MDESGRISASHTARLYRIFRAAIDELPNRSSIGGTWDMRKQRDYCTNCQRELFSGHKTDLCLSCIKAISQRNKELDELRKPEKRYCAECYRPLFKNNSTPTCTPCKREAKAARVVPMARVVNSTPLENNVGISQIPAHYTR